ncbi:MAG: hypothetical protein LBF22_11780 [Deltaproteobacteria bacterium]|jgi:hypothetical protein|nr:hypothetical protein [Deltaproteobacteria bacterium]
MIVYLGISPPLGGEMPLVFKAWVENGDLEAFGTGSKSHVSVDRDYSPSFWVNVKEIHVLTPILTTLES